MYTKIYIYLYLMYTCMNIYIQKLLTWNSYYKKSHTSIPASGSIPGVRWGVGSINWTNNDDETQPSLRWFPDKIPPTKKIIIKKI